MRCGTGRPEAEGVNDPSDDWKVDSLRWRGRVLVGIHAHWCLDWDGLPIDETCPEWPCACSEELEKERQP